MASLEIRCCICGGSRSILPWTCTTCLHDLCDDCKATDQYLPIAAEFLITNGKGTSERSGEQITHRVHAGHTIEPASHSSISARNASLNRLPPRPQLKIFDADILSHCRLHEYDISDGIVLMGNRQYDLYSCFQDCVGLITAVGGLIGDGLGKETLSILVDDPLRPGIVKTAKLSLNFVAGLLQKLLNIVRNTFQEPPYSFPADHRRLLEVFGEVKNVLRHLRLQGRNVPTKPNRDIDDTASEQKGHVPLHEFLALCRQFHSVLSLAICCHIGSHVFPFDKAIHQCAANTYMIDDGFVLRKKLLSPLKMFLSVPVWVFQEAGETRAVDGLSISIQEMIDCWGKEFLSWTQSKRSPAHQLCNLGRHMQLLISQNESYPICTEIRCFWKETLDWNSSLVPQDERLSNVAQVNLLLPEHASLLILARPDLKIEGIASIKAKPKYTSPDSSSKKDENKTAFQEFDRQDGDKIAKEDGDCEQSTGESGEDPNLKTLPILAKPSPELKCTVLQTTNEPAKALVGDGQNSNLRAIDGRGHLPDGNVASNIVFSLPNVEGIDLMAVWQRVMMKSMDNFRSNIDKLFANAAGIISCPTSADEASQPSSSVLETSNSNTSQAKQKRTYKDLNSDYSDDGNGRKQPSRKPRTRRERSPNSKGKKLACHFFARNPVDYQHEEACTGPGFSKITYLKDHLDRRHKRPLQCMRCWKVMANENDLLVHNQSEVVCTRVDRSGRVKEGVSAEQRELIRSRRPFEQAFTPEEQWEVIWNILFENEIPIPSPYHIYARPEAAISYIRAEQRRIFRIRFEEHLAETSRSILGSIEEQIIQNALQPLPSMVEESYEQARQAYESVTLGRNTQISDSERPSSDSLEVQSIASDSENSARPGAPMVMSVSTRSQALTADSQSEAGRSSSASIGDTYVTYVSASGNESTLEARGAELSDMPYVVPRPRHPSSDLRELEQPTQTFPDLEALFEFEAAPYESLCSMAWGGCFRP